uniref:Family with sequence similarity 162, member A n=3 Tax=Nothobranchius TaxID=28779 RepID=A0A1A7ZLR8_NOTFU
MNFMRSRLSSNNFIGQRFRGMCNKLQETKAESSPAASAQEPRPLFKVPGYKPSNLDKKMLVWSGRFKSLEQIPEIVSFEMIDAARNKIRVKAAYVMMGLTIGACVVMVILGKKVSNGDCAELYFMHATFPQWPPTGNKETKKWKNRIRT